MIGWFGRLEESKDPMLALRVFQELAAKGRNFEAWIAGDGALRETVERKVRAEKLNTVRLLGLLEPHELAGRLHGTTVALATSRWEGIPRGLIEAMACGVPVVCTDVGDVRSLISPDSGILVSGREPADLIAAIDHVVGHSSREMVAKSVAYLEAERVIPSLLRDIEAPLVSCGRS